MEHEKKLIERACHDDQEAWLILVRQHWDNIHRYVRARCRDHHLAEDVTQDVLAKAAARIREFRGGLFAAWLITIARTTLADHLRRLQSRQPPDGKSMLDIHALQETVSYRKPSADPEGSALERERAEAVGNVLAALPDDERAAIVWKRVEDLPLNVVAERLKTAFPDKWGNAKLWQVRYHLQKVQEQIKERLRQVIE